MFDVTLQSTVTASNVGIEQVSKRVGWLVGLMSLVIQAGSDLES